MKPKCLLLIFLLLGNAAIFAAEPWKTLEIWPEGAPNEDGQAIGEQSYKPDAKPEIPILQNVSKPTLTIYRADGEAPKPAVIICPGGGYNILADKHEGSSVAEWLTTQGYTALVLRYRVPRRKNREPHEAPLEDARQALLLAHQNAAAWGIDPERLGIGGFSAGGNLAARAAYTKGTLELPNEQQPDFAVLIYPAYLVTDDGESLNPDFEISENSPPAFLAHAYDDGRKRPGFVTHPDGSARLFLALSAVNVPAELHIYRDGGHGFGILDRNLPVNSWPARCEAWLAQMYAPK